MSAMAAPNLARFVRRTTLGENEYRVNFKQIDNEIIKALVSTEARSVTPLMSSIYLGLLSSPPSCWEREGVLHFTGEDRTQGTLTAWERMREIAGVANSTLSKAIEWMHKAGVIGYDARANGVGIRIFFNRATSSIRSRPAQKNLRLLPAPSGNAPTPSNGMGFKENTSEKDLEKLLFRANARENPSMVETISSVPPAKTSSIRPDLKIADSQGPGFDPGFTARLTRQIAGELRPEITAAVKRGNESTREWFLNHGLPKATRVAQRETFDLLRAHGVLAKGIRKTADPGRNHLAPEKDPEKGREGKGESQPLVDFLSECAAGLERAAENASASNARAVNALCLPAIEELRQLQAMIGKDSSSDSDRIEKRLAEIETRIIEGLWNGLSPDELQMLGGTAREELKVYAVRMSEAEFEEIVHRRTSAALLDRYGMPRLNLFYA